MLPGVYVWGKDWIQAKTQAECYDYLFEAAVKMAQLGINASVPPPPPLITANGAAVAEGKRHAEAGGHAGQDGFLTGLACVASFRDHIAGWDANGVGLNDNRGLAWSCGAAWS